MILGVAPKRSPGPQRVGEQFPARWIHIFLTQVNSSNLTHISYPLVMSNIAIENGHRKFVDLLIKNGFSMVKRLPEGRFPQFSSIFGSDFP